MQKIRAIIIDPNKRTITEQMILPTLPAFYEIIGCEYIEIFTQAPILRQTSHFLYIDENGGYKQDSKYFVIAGYPQPIRGTAILMKSEPPEEVSATLSIHQVEKNILFSITAEI